MNSPLSRNRRRFLLASLALIGAACSERSNSKSLRRPSLSFTAPTDEEITWLTDPKARSAAHGDEILVIRNRRFSAAHRFDELEFENITFDNCNFVGHEMYGVSLHKVQFIECGFADTEWERGDWGNLLFRDCSTVGSGVKLTPTSGSGETVFEGCSFEGFLKQGAVLDDSGKISAPGKSRFNQCKFDLMILRCDDETEFHECEISALDIQKFNETTQRILLDNCKGHSIDFSFTHRSITVRNSNFDWIGFERMSGDSVTLENVKRPTIGMLGTQLRRFSATGCVFHNVQTQYDPKNGGGLRAEQADITELNITDCRFEGPNAELFALGEPSVFDKNGKLIIQRGGSGSIIPYHATFGTINWRNTPMLRAELSYATIGRFNLENTTVSDSQFANAEIGELNLKNVTLAGKMDFANAKVKKVTSENLTRAPGLKLIKDGATLDL